MEIEKNLRTGRLLGIYGSLLTERQREIMSMYFDDDLSLSEIAEHFSISRQGVHDAVKRGEETLESCENSLGVADSQDQQRAQLLQLRAQAMDALDECRKVSFTKNIADKIILLLENLDSKLKEYQNTDYN